MSQLARIKEIVEWRNENIIEETYATHLAFDSIEQIIDYEETEINNTILDNITANEKFKIICRAKNFDIQELAEDIYDTINWSDYEDADEYLNICAYENDFVDLCDKYCLDIDSEMLNIFDNELNDKEKEFIKLALQCEINNIVLLYK